jgi:hypothetical protein
MRNTGGAARQDGPVTGVSRWRESGKLKRAVESAGRQESFAVAVSAMLEEARGWPLAEMRK